MSKWTIHRRMAVAAIIALLSAGGPVARADTDGTEIRDLSPTIVYAPTGHTLRR